MDRNKIQVLEKCYPAGTRIELIHMDDVASPPPGTLGTVTGVDGIGDIIVHWDNGSGLNLVPEVDRFRVVKDKE